MPMSISTESAVRVALQEAIDADKLNELGNSDIGYLPDDLHGLMVEACMNVVRAFKAVDEYHVDNETDFSK